MAGVKGQAVCRDSPSPSNKKPHLITYEVPGCVLSAGKEVKKGSSRLFSPRQQALCLPQCLPRRTWSYLRAGAPGGRIPVNCAE